jgi:SPP1 family predicted phage head-tail adaptor
VTRVFIPPLLGMMRKRIVVESPPTVVQTDGGPSATWIKVCDAWASLMPTGGKELYIGGVAVQMATNTFTIRMRYQAGITAAMRATYQGRTFNFTAVNDTGELHRDLEITALEVTS